jgi:hypothetical protein
MMTAGRSFSPPGSPAVIAQPFKPHGPSANAPVASLAGSVLAPRFHAWYGRSKRRTICSVYPVAKSEAGRGLPDFTAAIVIAVRRECGLLRSLTVFAFGDGEDKQVHVEEAVALGASEWHVHLLADSENARRAALRDLQAG